MITGNNEKILIQNKGIVARVAIDYWNGLKGLFTCPREIWLVFLLKVMESLAYFSSVLMLMHFLTMDMGLSDEFAGTVFGLFSAAMSLFMLFVGFVADSLGIKKAMLGGLVIALIGRLAITFTTNPVIVYPGLFFLAVAFAWLIPLLAAAVKIYSNKRVQKYAFSWYYVVMNVGSFIAGISLDWLRGTFTEAIRFTFLGMDLAIRPLQIIFLVSVMTTLAAFIIVIFFLRDRKNIPEAEFNEKPVDKVELTTAPKLIKEHKSPWRIAKEVGSERMFWVFILFIFLLVMVKMIFQYNHSLYPLYMERIGLKEWTGKLYAINPLIIIFLVPVMTAITGNMHAYKVITLGSFISAGSVLILGLGEGIIFVVFYQVVLSFGEAVYSPRVYDYTASIAPPGKESSYMAFSKMPMFFAKLAAGPLSGILLANLCAPEGARNSELMWILVGASTLISPITLLIGRKWLDVEKRREAGTL